MCNEESKPMRVNTKMRDLVEQAKRDGWVVSRTNKNHLRSLGPRPSDRIW